MKNWRGLEIEKKRLHMEMEKIRERGWEGGRERKEKELKLQGVADSVVKLSYNCLLVVKPFA
jgi:hypothetical protein